MKTELLVNRIDEITQTLSSHLEAGEKVPALGLRRSARLPVLATLHARLNQPTLLITNRADHALILLEELAIWAPQAPRLYFPEPNPLFYEKAEWGETTRRDRLFALTAMAAYHIPGVQTPELAPIIVAPARALMTRTISRQEFLMVTRSIKSGQALPPEELTRLLATLGYEPVNTVILPGKFARRGGLIDLWPPADSQPTRVEYFGDDIDSLRHFDPTTQRTTQATVRLLITPAREFLSHRTILDEGEQELSEFFIPVLHPTPASLLDYLPKGTVIMIDDHQALQEAVNEIEEQALELRRDYIADGTIDEAFPLPYLTWTEIADSLPRYSTLDLGAYLYDQNAAEPFITGTSGATDRKAAPASKTTEISHSVQKLGELFQAGPRFGGRLKLLMEHLLERYQHGEQIVIISRQMSRLQALWKEHSRHLMSEGATNNLPSPTFIQGSLAEGWTLNIPGELLLHLYTDGEIFGWRRPEPRQRQRTLAESPEALYSDLQTGDFVVHIDHGIGCFIGLVNRTIDGIEREYLCIEFADEAQLFVPVHQADRVTRYVGPDGRPPSLSRLGGTEWRNVKSHVKEAVLEVAEELLELYAQRSVIHGYAFSADSPWQQELEASFPYIETEDQMRVLAEVKRDMETPRPMDRLICGDVGYGKTEVALRAAFKAVLDGRQVAMLVPTTVLAQQHFQTFRERLEAFPVEVEMLSRFRTPQQQRRILKRLSKGTIDIVIGTHRLLSNDVEFKDLGLLIIDEEQRFGVTHKETLKKMRTEVDVLTLTATPIPRTLYMTLTGVRDISTINTPPEERLPILTHVGPYSPKLARQAILRELERGGQVFFVHNRVQTIEGMRQHLERLVPEARIKVAHGQMVENQLSERMKQFASGEVDVLLSTSIIESGLDIPNANTLIVDRADTFGLAQLYQLRGRVGRGAQRAHAYFFRHARRQPTIEGRQRLETIAENTQLGAGFSIAMRDLEIRGAGDLLGTRQHGHIAAVGFHLYTRLMADAVRRLRGKTDLPLAPVPIYGAGEIALPVNVDLPLAAGIPASYVPDKNMRLHLYRRMAEIRTLEELEALWEEFKDRFGPPPVELDNLIYQLTIKLTAEQAGLASVTSENGQLVLRFPDTEVPSDLPAFGSTVRVGKTALWMPYKLLENWRVELLEVLQTLRDHQLHALAVETLSP